MFDVSRGKRFDFRRMEKDKMDCRVRLACAEDAESISRVIIQTLKETNAKDYSAEIIERVSNSFSPTAIGELIKKRVVLVTTVELMIAGTASLEGETVRTVFVDPSFQGKGIGRLLMTEIERIALERDVSLLSVPSSVTAEPFYAKLGFKSVSDSYYGDERTIIMEKLLLPEIRK